MLLAQRLLPVGWLGLRAASVRRSLSDAAREGVVLPLHQCYHQHRDVVSQSFVPQDTAALKASSNKPPVMVYVQGVQDTRNMAHIIQACHVYGVDQLFLSKNGNAKLSSAVNSISNGALDRMLSRITTVMSDDETYLRLLRMAGVACFAAASPTLPAVEKASNQTQDNSHAPFRLDMPLFAPHDVRMISMSQDLELNRGSSLERLHYYQKHLRSAAAAPVLPRVLMRQISAAIKALQNPATPRCILIGNEQRGLKPSLVGYCDAIIAIPQRRFRSLRENAMSAQATRGRKTNTRTREQLGCDSLNVALATAAILSEFVLHRSNFTTSP